MSIVRIPTLKYQRKAKSGIISDYLEYTKEQESPSDFHLWMAIGTIASAMMRNCWTSQGYFKIFPNLYIILAGNSAVTKKSTALGMAEKILYEALGPNLNCFSQKGTTESFIHYMSELTKVHDKAETLISVSEFATFIGKSDQDQTLIQQLTDYYDCPEVPRSYTTLKRGKEEVKLACVNMFAGSTLEWLKSSLPEDSLGGGFMSRLNIIFREGSEVSNAFPTITREMIDFRDNCVNDLKAIASLSGEFSWTKDAKDTYENWYCNYLKDEIKNAPTFLSGYYGRKATTVIKLAMIASANYDDMKVIKASDINFAIKTLLQNEVYLRTFITSFAQTTSGKLIDLIRDIVRKSNSGWIYHTDLIRKVSHKMDAQETRKMLDTLIEGGEVLRVKEGQKTVYKFIKEEE